MEKIACSLESAQRLFENTHLSRKKGLIYLRFRNSEKVQIPPETLVIRILID